MKSFTPCTDIDMVCHGVDSISDHIAGRSATGNWDRQDVTSGLASSLIENQAQEQG